MKKKFIVKVIAAAAAAAQLMTCTAFASVISGNGGTDSMSYWYEDFADGITTMKKSSGSTTEDAGGAVKISTTLDAKFGYVSISNFDFSRPIVISYDYTPQDTKAGYTVLMNGDTTIAFMTRFENGRIKGYTSALAKAYANSTTTHKTDGTTTYKVQNSLSYNAETEKLTVKQYVNGKQLIAQSDSTTPLEYTVDATLAASMVLRFVVGKGGSGIVDNIMVRQEGEINLPGGAWIKTNSDTGVKSAGVTYTDSAKYVDANGEDVKLPYTVSVNNIAANNTVTGAAKYYTLKKYNIADDPFLFSGTDADSRVVWSGAGGITVSGLEQASNDEIFVLKLKDTSNITNFAGQPTKNIYTVLHNYGETMTAVRESEILDADGAAISLEDGKLPTNIDKINFTLAYNSALTTDNITFKGSNADIKATEKNGVYTLDLSGVTLEEATDYTITVGEISKTYTTTGTVKKMSAAIERFDDQAAIDGMYNSDATNITIALENGRMKYDNTLEATATTKRVEYAYERPFDFSKGSMYVSFDVELNQAITYIKPPEGVTSASYLFNPQIQFGSKLAGYMPSIETYGIRGRASSGARVKTNNELDTMKVGNTCTIGMLATYYPDKTENNVGYIQFVNGERLCAENGEAIPEYFVTRTESELEAVPTIEFYGRNFADGGLYIDNLSITTVDGITADSIINMTSTTAQINIKNTVEFDEGTDPELTAVRYISSLAKSDISVTKYAKDDTLLINGETVTDFTFDSETLTIGNLDSGSVYVIKLSAAEKLQSLSGKSIDKTVFKAGNGTGGLVKTTIIDSNGAELYVDADGLVPSNAAKIKFTFADGYVTGDVLVGDKTAAADENGDYVVDLTSSPLAANTAYDVTVNSAVYGSFTTSDGAITVSVPVIGADGKGTVTITNTTSSPKTVYIINAAFKTSEELTSLVYESVTVNSGETKVYTTQTAPSTTGAAMQKIFAWDGFEQMIPYCEAATGTVQ